MGKLVVCNQKMFLTPDEALIIKSEMDELNISNVDLVVSPNYLNFNIFKDYTLCAQDCFYEDSGAYTSMVSPYHLSLLGFKYSLVGHSETRNKTTNDEINLKIKALLRNSITPILCVGETKLEKDMMRTSEVLRKEIKVGLSNINPDDYQEIIIAYEPSWIIGTNKQLSKKDIIDTIMYIKKVLEEVGINKYKVIYGGNVSSNNIEEINDDIIDGYLLGSSSTSVEKIKKIINCIK